jgi:hypothetical protein
MPAPKNNIVELRELLARKFPGAKTGAPSRLEKSKPVWATGWKSLDDSLRGGFGKGALTECVAAPGSSGGASLVRFFLRQSYDFGQWTALIDGRDSLDLSGMENDVFSRMLWARCRTADEAMKAADFLLRDGNLSIVLLDLALNSASELRKIPPTAWYRLQRILEGSGAVFIAVTPWTMVPSAQTRLIWRNTLSLESLDQGEEEHLRERHFELTRHESTGLEETATQENRRSA